MLNTTYKVVGCKARYTVSGALEVGCRPGAPTTIALVHSIQRFGLTFLSDEIAEIPTEGCSPVRPLPWKGECELLLGRLNLSLGGTFYGDSVYYLPVLTEIALRALLSSPPDGSETMTEMAYGFRLALDAERKEALTRYLRGDREWLESGQDRFAYQHPSVSGRTITSTLELDSGGDILRHSFERYGFLRPVEAIAEAEINLMKAVGSLPFPVRVFRLG